MKIFRLVYKSKYFSLLFCILFSIVTLGVNPIEKTVAPMDLITSHKGWENLQMNPGEIEHHARSDVIDSMIPLWRLIKDELYSGNLLLWNPLRAGGAPGLLTVDFSPSFFVFLLIPNDSLAFYFSGFIKLFLGIMGMYLFLRIFIKNKFSALFGGGIFTLTGFNSAWFFVPASSVAILFPWLFWSISKFIFTGRAIFTVYTSLFSALIIFSWFPSVAAYGFYAASILILLLVILFFKTWKLFFQQLFILFLSIFLGFLTASFFLLSWAELLSFIDISYRKGTSTSFSLRDFFLFFTPYKWGTPHPEKTVYSGLLATLLAIIAIFLLIKNIFSLSRQKFQKQVLLFFGGILLILSITISFGLIDHDVIRAIPTFNFNPWSRMVVITGFAIAILAAVIFDLIREKTSKFPVVMITFLGIVFSVQVFDQIRFFQDYNARVPHEWFYPETKSIAYVHENVGEFQTILADSSFMVPGSLGGNFIPELGAHSFRSQREKSFLEILVDKPFKTTTAAVFSSADIYLQKQKWFDIAGVKYLLLYGNPPYVLLKSRILPGKSIPTLLPPNKGITIDTFSPNIDILFDNIEFLFGTYGKNKDSYRLEFSIIEEKENIRRQVYKNFHVLSIIDNQWNSILLNEEILLKRDYSYQFILTLKNDEKLALWSSMGEGRHNPKYKLSYRNYEKYGWKRIIEEENITILENIDVSNGAYWIDVFPDSLPQDVSISDTGVITKRIDDSTIKIQVTSLEKPGWLVLPMRIYPGWEASMNNERIDAEKFLGIFPAFYVKEPGTITYKYYPTNLNRGFLLSCLGVFLIFALYLYLLRSTSKN